MADDSDERDDEYSSLVEEQAKSLIRVDPDHDATNGFFVACFQREKSGDGKKKKKKKKTAWKPPSATATMQLYDNGFHGKEYAPKATTDEAKSKKRKQPSDEKGADTKSKPAADASNAISKKKAKKLEWKKQQRLKKEARLKRKQAEQSDTK